MVNLWVELDGIKVAGRVGGDRKRRVGRGAINLKPGGDLRDVVAMAHPDLFAAIVIPAIQQGQFCAGGGDIGPAEFGCAMATFNPTAKAVHHHLLAVAYAQYRHPQFKNRCGRHRRAIRKDRGRAARKYHGLWREIPNKGVVHPVEWVNFAIDVQFAQASRNKLRYLAAEIDDKQAFMGLGHGVRHIALRRNTQEDVVIKGYGDLALIEGMSFLRVKRRYLREKPDVLG